MMGVTYVSFIIILFFVLLVIAMVTWAIIRGVEKDFALTYDFYLWREFASSEEELAKKIDKKI
jgi:hypothetical protein